MFYGTDEGDCIELDSGVKVWIHPELTVGADEAMADFDKAKGGNGGAVWDSKLLQLAIIRVDHGGGNVEEGPLSLDKCREVKGSVMAQLKGEIMSRWYPLFWKEWTATMAALEAPEATPNGGSPSIGTEELAQALQNGQDETSS